MPSSPPGQPWRLHPDRPLPSNATVRPVLRRSLQVGLVVTVFALAALLLSRTIADSVGLTGILLGLLAASTAIGIVVPVFLWVDRLEPEPPKILFFAFLWGGLISTLGALLLNTLGVAIFAGLEVDATVAGAVFVAPAVEEGLKCLGVLLIFLVAPREFNGVVDGIVYAGVTAAGFAFVENILYLGTSYDELGTSGLVSVFVLRCLMSPFAHPMFTVCFGIALGLITHRRTLGAALVPLFGYASAVFLHALWNVAAMSAGHGFFVVYAVVQVPLFVAFLLILGWARAKERRMVRDNLTGYGLNGWFNPSEVAMVTSPAERRRARAWARSRGGRAAELAMESFQDEAAELAIAKQHLDRGAADPQWLEREAGLLQRLREHRMAFGGFAAAEEPGRR